MCHILKLLLSLFGFKPETGPIFQKDFLNCLGKCMHASTPSSPIGIIQVSCFNHRNGCIKWTSLEAML
jgi:hypothetical protein